MVCQRQDQLYKDLNRLLDTFCTDNQSSSVLRDQPMANDQQLMLAIQQVKTFMPAIRSRSVQQALSRLVSDCVNSYRSMCAQQRLNELSESSINQLVTQWQQLSKAYDAKNQELLSLSHVIEDIYRLKSAWKRSYQAQSLVSTLLTHPMPTGTYITTIDRSNYGQLGFNRTMIGSRQIVFDCQQLSRKQQMDHVSELCHRFHSLFSPMARKHLDRIDAQMKRTEPSYLAAQLKLLQDQIFQHVDTLMPPSSSSSSSSSSPASTGPVITTIAAFSFVPTPWQWPSLLKERIPYNPLFFGFIKRRSAPLLAKLFGRPGDTVHQAGTAIPSSGITASSAGETETDREAAATFATVSVNRLTKHFCNVIQQFYEDVLVSTQQKYSDHDAELQRIRHELLVMYRSLQLEGSRAIMQHVLGILNELNNGSPTQQPFSQENAGGFSAQDTSPPLLTKSAENHHLPLPPTPASSSAYIAQ